VKIQLNLFELNYDDYDSFYHANAM